MPKRSLIRYFSKNLLTVFGIVLIWRGVWSILDMLDVWLFGGKHVFSAIVSIALGIFLLYVPDRNLKELEKI